MSKRTKHSPERGSARTRLLEAARDIIREKGFAATSIDDLCKAADVTKGAFFHHFDSKEALGVAVAGFWAETTSRFFRGAPYHASNSPLQRILDYVAFRKAIIVGGLAEFTCLVGTMAQEVHASHPAIRDACGQSIFGQSATLEADIEAARQAHGISAEWTAESLARHTQAVLQGGFILAKAGNDPELARESLDHLDRYIRHLFGIVEEKGMNKIMIGCACGKTRLEVEGKPILVAECLCNSCRSAADRLAKLSGARNILTSYRATPCAEYRKDRVRIVSGTGHLREFRLSPDAGSRRVVATCCNTPVFLEMKGAHWLSIYLHLWPLETRPKAQLRTMVGDLADPSGLPEDIPNLKSHTIAFYAKLFAAWVGMCFRNPKIDVAGMVEV